MDSLPQSHQSFYRLDQLRGVVTDSVFKDDFHFFNIRDICCWIAADHDDARGFANFKRLDAFVIARELCTVQRRKADRLNLSVHKIFLQNLVQ